MADKSLFTRLERLFSTDVLIRNVGGDNLRTVDINQIQMSGDIQTNSLFDRYARLYTTSTSLYGQNTNINFQVLRPQLYSEYDVMDTDAIVASALDILADESTLKNDQDEVLQIRSSDENIQRILYNLFYDVLNIEFNAWSWIRNMCKYGDFFLKLEIAEKYGIYNVIPYTAYHIERKEGYDPKNPHAVKFVYSPEGLALSGTSYSSQYNQNNNSIVFDNYEVAHFRLLSDTNLLPYGRSYLEPARKLFKQYTLMEDAMLIHRIVRAPERRIFYINVGGIAPSEVEGFMQKTINTMKRTPYIDPETGQYNLKYNMQNLLEDFYIPTRPGDNGSTKLDTTKGLEYTAIDDVVYLRDKLFAALKVPKAFMGYEKDLTGKATLAAEDIRFARTVERLQRIVVSELYKIALIHLYTQGYTGESLANFSLSLTTPSIIYDQEKIALMKEKISLAKDMIESNLFSSDHIYDTVYHMSDDQFDEMRDLVREDAKRKFRLQQIENEGNDPAESGVSYGTPHDLATLYGKGRMGQGDIPIQYNEKVPLGRPEEKVSNINTQDNVFGKDRLGKKAMKYDDQPKKIDLNFKGGSPLALESNAKVEYLKNQKLLENIKTNIFKENVESELLLDENQLKTEK